MTLKLIRNFIPMIFIMFLLHGCGSKTPKVGFCMDSLIPERWEKDRELFVQNIENLGGEVLVEIANGDDVLQLEQAEKLISEGVDVLVVIPVNQETAGHIVVAAHKAGVKVISYDRLIRNCNLDYYVSTDNIRIGEQQADYLTRIKPKGKYVLIGGAITDNNAQLLYLGQLNILQPLITKGDIEIIFHEFTHDWQEKEGYDLMKMSLDQNDNMVDAVIASNDALASGVIRALEEKDLAGKVLVAGQDADMKAIKQIVAGTQTMTIYKPIDAIASTAARLAMKLANGESPEIMNLTVNNGKKLVPSFLLESMVVHKDNIKMTVVSEGFLEEHDIYQ